VLLGSGVLPAGILSAQAPVSLRFQSLTINEGLSQGFVAGICRDKQGFMWFATGDGLDKYDGYGFTVFHHEANDSLSLGSDDLTCVYEDEQGRMWVGTRNDGLELFDRKSHRFSHFRRGTSGLWSDNILGITGDRHGNLWVRTRMGVDRVAIKDETSVFTHILLDSLFEKGKDRYGAPDLLIDSREHIYLISNTRIVELIDDTLHHSYELEQRYRLTHVDSIRVPALLEDTVTHALLLKTDAVTIFPHHDFTAPRILYSTTRTDLPWMVDSKGTIWLADTGSILRLDLRTGERQRVVIADAMQRKAIAVPTAFYADTTGVLWLGSGGYGLLMHDPELERFHHLTSGINTYQLLMDNAGRLLTNNFTRIDLSRQPIQQEQLVDEPTMKKNFPRIPAISLAKDDAGKLWMGIHGGLLKYDPDTRQTTRFDLPFGQPAALPFPIYAGSRNVLWMGYEGYFLRYDIGSGSWLRIAWPDRQGSYEYDFLQTMYEQDGLLWLGSVSGLYCWDIRQERMIHVYRHRQQDATSISNNFILSLCPDAGEPRRYLWIGTKGGLNRLDLTTGSCSQFTRENGLVDNVIYGILPDGQGNLWFSTNRGLMALYIPTGSLRNFDVGDGLQGNEFNRYAYCRMKDGSLAFGGLNGITWFDPKEIRQLDPPPVVITGIRLFNRPGTGPVGDTLSLQYRQNILTLRYVAMDYRKHASLRYRYRLEGFDKDWIDAASANEATYTNLDPGSYTFSVQASFANGPWGTRTASMTIVVHPPWWKTAWFYAFVAAIALAVLYAAHRYRIQQLSRAAELRDRIARDLHDEVGSSVSTIAIYSKIAYEQAGNPGFDNKPILQKVSDYATQIMESMNDIVWSINTRNDAFEQIVSRMRDHASQLLEAAGYTIHFDFDDGLSGRKLDMEKRRHLYLLFKESLNNILKYAGGSQVWITFGLTQKQFRLAIRDDGRGFEPDTVKRGNGLSNMRHRAKTLHGDLSLQSRPGYGTHLILVFPA
jgi:signal transduction histidine kinase/ligand-binding sensor domain-containing protein